MLTDLQEALRRRVPPTMIPPMALRSHVSYTMIPITALRSCVSYTLNPAMVYANIDELESLLTTNVYKPFIGTSFQYVIYDDARNGIGKDLRYIQYNILPIYALKSPHKT